MSATIPTLAAIAAVRLAAADDRCLAAIAAGCHPDPASRRFAAWLADHWRPTGPPEPDRPPDEESAGHQGFPRVRWYADAGTVRGYVAAARGCYDVPLDAALSDG